MAKRNRKKSKWLWVTIGVLAIAGGAVHVADALGNNLLSVAGSWATAVQVSAGVAGLVAGWLIVSK